MGCVVVVEVWWNVIHVIVYILVLSRQCCTSGIVCVLPVVDQKFFWRVGVLEEQDCAVVDVSHFWPSF